MWPYPWTHVGTPSDLGHMDQVAATMPSQAHAGAAQEAHDIGQWEGQEVLLVRPSSCNVKGGIPSLRRYLPTYLINARVRLGDATEPFLQALAEAYRQMAMLGPTIIISDMNAAPTQADQGGQATPQDQAVRDTVKMLGLVDLTANLEGQPSHFPHKTEAAPSRIDVCYGDPTTMIRAEARYGPLPPGPTGHIPLHIRLTILNLPPSPPEDAAQGLSPPLQMPPLHDKQAWSEYHRAIDRARRIQRDHSDLLTAMCTAAVACGFQQHPHTEDHRPPTARGDMFHDRWHAKQQQATLLHTDTPKTCRHIQHCRTQIAQNRQTCSRGTSTGNGASPKSTNGMRNMNSPTKPSATSTTP